MTEEKQKEIEYQLGCLRRELAAVKGTPCEVYSRVVGYLRPVQSWNKGKKEEYKLRCNYDLENKKED